MSYQNAKPKQWTNSVFIPVVQHGTSEETIRGVFAGLDVVISRIDFAKEKTSVYVHFSKWNNDHRATREMKAQIMSDVGARVDMSDRFFLKLYVNTRAIKAPEQNTHQVAATNDWLAGQVEFLNGLVQTHEQTIGELTDRLDAISRELQAFQWKMQCTASIMGGCSGLLPPTTPQQQSTSWQSSPYIPTVQDNNNEGGETSPSGSWVTAVKKNNVK